MSPEKDFGRWTQRLATTLIGVSVPVDPGAHTFVLKRGAELAFCAALSFVAFSGRADAPPGRYTLSATGVVDNETGLLWEVPAPVGTMAYAAAVAHWADREVAGVSDWRLPSMKELQTLVDDTRIDPAIDTTAFPDTGPLETFWSSSPYPVPGHYWIVQFNSGVTPGGAVDELYRTRCVR